MKKILFMITSMNIGGVEKSLLSLLAIMPREKYDITVLVLEKKGGFLEFMPDWVKVEEAAWFKKIKPIIMQPPQQTIKDYLRDKQFIKILLFTLAYFLSKLLGNRYIYYRQVLAGVPQNVNTYDAAITYQGPTDIIDYYIANKVKAAKKISWVHFDVSKYMIDAKLYQRLYEKIDKLFVVSEEAKHRLTERIPTVKGKAEVFLNIVPLALINEMSKETVDFDDDYRGIKIVTVGRLAEEKGQDLAIKVLAKLRKNGYEVRWYCVGDGWRRIEYEKQIAGNDLRGNFVLLEATPNPYPFMAKADIYVQTSRHEGYCLTLAEAKCLCKPIVTTNFTGASEQIEDGRTGMIVACNEEELYRKIKYLIDHETERDKLSQNLAKENFDTNAEIKKLFDYIQ